MADLAVIDRQAPAKIEWTDEQVRVRALQWVNALREEYGHEALDEIPRGTHASNACPMAVALAPLGGRVEVGLKMLTINGQGRFTPMPLREFVRRFDSGRYPDLDAAPAFKCVNLVEGDQIVLTLKFT